MEDIWEKTQKEWIKNLLLAYKPNTLSENLWGRVSEMVGYFNPEMKDCSSAAEQVACSVAPRSQRMEPSSATTAVLERSGEPCVKRLVCSPDLPVFSLAHTFDEVAVESTTASPIQDKDYQCSFCSKTFTQKTTFQNHLRSHGKEGEDPYECNICGKTFAVPARLTRHYRTHTGEKPYQCEFCNKSFSVKENLSVHRRIHTKERPYKCEICERAFEHSGKLHRHMRIHTGERPHKCAICSKTFIQSGQLVIHMRTHTGEKPYVCKVCTKGFTCSKQLKVHTRTHTGEKPYTCDICGKSFGYNHVLKLHQVAHYGEKVYKCTICNETFTSKKTMEVHIKSHSDPSVTVTMRNTQSTGKVGVETIESCSSSGSDKENKGDSDCEPVQQVRIPSRPSSSSTNEYEIDETRESSLSPATVVFDPPYIIPDSQPYSYNACTPSPPPSQPQSESHEQESPLIETQPQSSFHYYYMRPEQNGNSLSYSQIQHQYLPHQRLSVGVNPALLAAAAVAAASDDNELSELASTSHLEDHSNYNQRLQHDEEMTDGPIGTSGSTSLLTEEGSAVLLPVTDPPVYVITSSLPTTLRRNNATYNVQVPLSNYSEESRSLLIDLQQLPTANHYSRDHHEDIEEDISEPILTPPSSNPVSPIQSSSPDPTDLTITNREMCTLPPRKRFNFNLLKPIETAPSVRINSVIQYAKAS